MSGFRDGGRFISPQDLGLKDSSRVSTPELLNRTLTDLEAVEAVKRTGFSFRDFMALGLYHPKGYFQEKVDYAETMSLLPKIMSPVFGASVAEAAYAMYRLTA